MFHIICEGLQLLQLLITADQGGYESVTGLLRDIPVLVVRDPAHGPLARRDELLRPGVQLLPPFDILPKDVFGIRPVARRAPVLAQPPAHPAQLKLGVHRAELVPEGSDGQRRWAVRPERTHGVAHEQQPEIMWVSGGS